ncbi:GNAT family N-acetyltransferase [Streptomyces sp. NPDC058067]|uniref:GNAT family N-acetyltransferase n=1 Tax=Streptomyces sp. NPDC058067 TaxID=3346324 RepID=UPI0036E89A2C
MELWHLDEDNLERLLAVAVDDADPGEVMPPVPGPPGWTPERREAFRAWHRARRPGLDGPLRERTYAIACEGTIVGSARLAVRGADTSGEVLEAGMWLARSRRGQGLGTATLRRLLAEAAESGARALVADTRTDNHAALTALRRNGATVRPGENPSDVHAELAVEEQDLPPHGTATPTVHPL